MYRNLYAFVRFFPKTYALLAHAVRTKLDVSTTINFVKRHINMQEDEKFRTKIH